MNVAAASVFGAITWAVATASPASAAANLVVNGDFEQFTNPSATPGSSYRVQTTANSNSTGTGVLTGWTNDGYSFVYNAGTLDKGGARISNGGSYLTFYGPANGVNNGLTATSPVTSTGGGGNMFASDGAYQQGALNQTISGLVVGSAYTLSFEWAGAQQTGFDGATAEGWGVTFGSQTYNVSNSPAGQFTQPDKGFTPWRQATFTFVPTSTTQTLSFLATGAPGGTPPFSLLDNVTLFAAPEPATWAIMTVALLATGFAARPARRKVAMRRGLTNEA